jgi:hypothetical protein
MAYHKWSNFKLTINDYCYNPRLGLATKAGGCKVAGQEGSPGVQETLRE